MIVEEVEEEVTLFLLEPDDTSGELRIDEEGLLAGCRMRSHERVNRCDGFTADDTTAVLAVIGLLDSCIVVSGRAEMLSNETYQNGLP